MNPTPEDRLGQLTEAHLKGELSAEEKAELAELLDRSEEARRRFVQLADFETALTRAHREPWVEASIDDLRSHKLPACGKPKTTSKLLVATQKALPWLIAAASLAIAFLPRSGEPPADKPSPPVTALLVNEAESAFAKPRAHGDVGFGPGAYELREGAIHLRFANGTDLVMEGPAKFEVLDVLHSRLHYGKVRAIVPPTAHGFTIATERANFEDLGTEFGLHVERDTGIETLHVFDGQVDVREPGSNALLNRVKGGQAVEYRDGEPAAAGELRPETFPTPGRIGYLRWAAEKERRRRDPNLIAFFSFDRDPQQPALLRNLQRGRAGLVSDARVEGARWVSGRWPGKGALLFERQSDFAELEFEGGFNELTIAAWVFLDRLDHHLNAILDSNGFEAGDIHLQVRRQGGPYVDIAEARVSKGALSTKTLTPVGKWVYLVATMSLPRRTAQVYVNGELAYRCALREEGRIRPGVGRIGNWLPTGEFEPVRSLNGRIDELTIWDRALTEAEIEAEMERGQPSLLWSK